MTRMERCAAMTLLWTVWACTTPGASGPVDGGQPDGAAPASDAAVASDSARPMDAAVAQDAAGPADAAGATDAGMTTDAAVTMDAAARLDAAVQDGGQPWRNSLEHCWNTSSCRRALLLSHGGDWGGAVPYGSHAAHVRAFENGADAVKVDVRVTQDGVPMVVHSSPLALYESLDCNGRRVEEMTAADLAGCHMVPSATETFPRLDDTIQWARGRINLMFTVKEARDFPAAMALAQALDATTFVFLEISYGDLLTTLPAIPGHAQFFYDVQVDSLTQLNSMFTLTLPPGVIMVALDLNEFTEPEADIAAAITTLVLPRGLHASICLHSHLTPTSASRC